MLIYRYRLVPLLVLQLAMALMWRQTLVRMDFHLHLSSAALPL